jgi:hypothetical protein
VAAEPQAPAPRGRTRKAAPPAPAAAVAVLPPRYDPPPECPRTLGCAVERRCRGDCKAPPPAPTEWAAPPAPSRPAQAASRAPEPLPELPYMGATLRLWGHDQGQAVIHWPGTDLHGHAFSLHHAKRAVEWWAETGGDPDRLRAYMPWLDAIRPRTPPAA